MNIINCNIIYSLTEYLVKYKPFYVNNLINLDTSFYPACLRLAAKDRYFISNSKYDKIDTLRKVRRHIIEILKNNDLWLLKYLIENHNPNYKINEYTKEYVDKTIIEYLNKSFNSVDLAIIKYLVSDYKLRFNISLEMIFSSDFKTFKYLFNYNYVINNKVQYLYINDIFNKAFNKGDFKVIKYLLNHVEYTDNVYNKGLSFEIYIPDDKKLQIMTMAINSKFRINVLNLLKSAIRSEELNLIKLYLAETNFNDLISNYLLRSFRTLSNQTVQLLLEYSRHQIDYLFLLYYYQRGYIQKEQLINYLASDKFIKTESDINVLPLIVELVNLNIQLNDYQRLIPAIINTNNLSLLGLVLDYYQSIDIKPLYLSLLRNI